MARRLLLGVLACAALAWARPAEASARFGLGADWVLEPGHGALQLTLAGDTRLAKNLSLGARVGVLYEAEPDLLAVPIDATLRLNLGRAYVEGLVGPWIYFDGGEALRLHAAIGFGVRAGDVQLGLEVGYREASSMLGVRVAIPF